MDDSAEVASIRRSILAHLRGAPDAADTLEGIAQWWLPRGAAVPLEAVEATLEALVREGRLGRRVLPDGTRLYDAAPSPRSA